MIINIDNLPEHAPCFGATPFPKRIALLLKTTLGGFVDAKRGVAKYRCLYLQTVFFCHLLCAYSFEQIGGIKTQGIIVEAETAQVAARARDHGGQMDTGAITGYRNFVWVSAIAMNNIFHQQHNSHADVNQL